MSESESPMIVPMSKRMSFQFLGTIFLSRGPQKTHGVNSESMDTDIRTAHSLVGIFQAWHAHPQKISVSYKIITISVRVVETVLSLTFSISK